jgi:hypothetical protein
MSNLYAAAQYLLFVFIVTALVKPLGGYMERGVCRKAYGARSVLLSG